jgi:type VI protein secretion system component Hcp
MTRIPSTHAVPLALAIAAATCSAPAGAASADYLLKIDTIPGETAAQGHHDHKDWIEVLSLRFKGGVRVAAGDVNGDGAAASGLPTGKRQHKPMVITKEWGTAAPANTAGPAAGGKLAAPGSGEQAALLLPAVQKVREAAARMKSWPGCKAGQRLSGVSIREAASGRTARILDAVVTQCAAESVSFNFTKIEWD